MGVICMAVLVNLTPLLSIIFGVIILIFPRALNYSIAIYLVLIGLIGIVGI